MYNKDTQHNNQITIGQSIYSARIASINYILIQKHAFLWTLDQPPQNHMKKYIRMERKEQKNMLLPVLDFNFIVLVILCVDRYDNNNGDYRYYY